MNGKLRLFTLLLFACSICTAQKSIKGTLSLKKTDNKDFILRNTKVMLVTKNGVDSTAINNDLSFSFDNVQNDSATIYLKSPVLSPNATTKFALRKNKPTRLKLNYDAIHHYSDRYAQREKSEDQFVKFNNTMVAIKLIADIFMAISLLHR